MTDHDLATLLRDHVSHEPPLQASADSAILAGRRVLRRRRMRRSATGIVAAAAIAAIAVPLASGDHGSGGQASLDPATRRALADYDAQAMPKALSDTVGAAVREWAPDLLGGDFAARDDQGELLPKQYWDKASQMDITYGLGEHTFRAILLHARSEAEGDARKNCANDIAAGYKFSCVVSTAPNGDLVTTSVIAVRRMDFVTEGETDSWGAVTPEELRTLEPAPGDPSQRPIDPDEIYFQRSVESVHSETFLTGTIERVKAPDLAHAKAAWQIPVSASVSIVTDPSLVIPEPPLGPGGCPWTWKTKVSCS